MSETEIRETAKERRAREAAEAAGNADGATGSTPEGTAESTPDGAAEASTETTARKRAPDVTGLTLDDINAATLAVPDLVAASAPVRERSDQQKWMDAVAVKAYDAWVKAKKPSVWQKIPVITYFLDDDDLPKYKYLIRRACSIVEPVDGSPGVRVRFGNEFTLSEAMAAKMERPDLAGKTVLAWAAVDKRATEDKAADS